MNLAKPEDILEQILHASNTGSDLEASPDLKDLAHIVALLRSVPKKTAPIATRRHLFLREPLPKPAGFLSFISNARLLTLSIGTLSFMAVLFAANSVQDSLPGGLIYPIKKAAEQLQVKYAFNKGSEVTLQFELTEKRLAEVETILAHEPSNPEATVAALTELANQTKTTVTTVQNAADEKTITAESKVVSQLNDITKRQLALLNSIEQTPSAQPLTEQIITTTKQSTTQVATIIKQLLTAVVKEGVLASTDQLPAIISGSITQLDKDGLTVDKTRIVFSEQTKVKTVKGEEVKLALHAKVSVSATTKDNVLTAIEVTVETIPQIDKETIKKTASPESARLPVEEISEPIHTVKGGFIIEDPTNQYTR